MTRKSAFDITAARMDGTVGPFVVEAHSRDAAVAEVRARGGFPIRVSRRLVHRPITSRLGRSDAAQGLRAIAILLSAGVPLSKAFAVLPHLVPKPWVAELPELQRQVEQGEPLSAVLQRPTLGVPSHVTGLIEAGERGSGLATAVSQAAAMLEQSEQERTALNSALAYPVLLATFGGASVLVLVGVVLPQFAILLGELGQALPLSTRVVLAIAAATRTAIVPSLAFAIAGVWAWLRWTREHNGLVAWHGWLLRVPRVGLIRAATATSRACSVLSALGRAGVPVSTALVHAAKACGDAQIEARLLRVRTRITGGESLSEAVGAESALTDVATRLARAGEETGALSEMLLNASRVESARASLLLQQVVRSIEPALILGFGAIVMAVAAALLQAMYGLRPTL